MNEMKYIYKTRNGSYTILKQIKELRKKVSYGTYKNKEQAIKMRDYYIKNNWIRDNFIKYDKSRRASWTGDARLSKPNAYIHRVKDHYEIRHRNNETRKIEIFGRFDNIDEARQERDLLREHDWDLDAVCDLH